MRITLRSGNFEPERDIEPTGRKLWEGGDDELPAAVLAALADRFEPGTWYRRNEFAEIVRSMSPLAQPLEVTSAVTTEQSGVVERWAAAIEVGQSKAALMVCTAVIEHAERLAAHEEIWIRVD